MALLVVCLLSGICLPASGQGLPLTSGPVLPLYRSLREVGLDSQKVYKIREAVIDREDIHIWLNDGVIAFTQNVAGRITGAYFEGEGEVLVRPPDRRERASLGLFTGQGVLDEHFSSVYLRFNDDTAADLQQYLRPYQDGAQFVARVDTMVRQLAAHDAMRLAISFTSGPLEPNVNVGPPFPDRMLNARFGSPRLGVFDVYFDTRAPEQINVGQIKIVDDQPYYDLWMSFRMRSVRQAQSAGSQFHGSTGPAWTRGAFQVGQYKIDAAIEPSLDLSADAVLEGVAGLSGPRIVLFELSRYLHLKSVEMDGQPLEFIQNETIPGSQLARRGNDMVAVVFPQPLHEGQRLQVKFTYAGSVLSDAGGGLFYVGARGTWYPNLGIAMAMYDITFRFPRVYTLVATGTRLGLQQEGNNAIGHWVSDGAIPIAGFNLGRYSQAAASAGNVEVISYAAAGVEDKILSARPSLSDAGVSPRVPPRGVTAEAAATPAPASPLLPQVSEAPLAQRAANTVTALEKILGPYPFRSLAITQRPGSDSQGWPGIVFLSSYVYLTPEQRTEHHISTADNVLYGEVMLPHEIAHQWFGDRVSWASYHEQWLMEAISNCVSLLLLEKQRPADAHLMLQTYRQLLATSSKDGLKNVEAGPVTLGVRLSSYKFPSGYEIITYGRGTWLLHMLREMFRDVSRSAADPAGSDAVFLGVLRSIYDNYQGKEITNADFEAELEAVLPHSLWFENRRSLDWFFDGWVNGTALPRLDVKDVRFSATPAKSTVTATLRQMDAPDDLVTSVPVYGMAGDNRIYLGRVFAVGAETRFTFPVPPGVKHIALDPNQTVLTAP
jgi:Peptidase family M1 domain